MCGITGIFDSRAPRSPDEALLRRMNDIQFHRGPDEGSVHVEPHVGFGHRRLSIIDVATGQQPLFNEDHSVVVVFNGEIYNFQALAAELEAAGHVFRTRSDTEVIVHGWEQWGEACVERFAAVLGVRLAATSGRRYGALARREAAALRGAVGRPAAIRFELKTIVAHPASDAATTGRSKATLRSATSPIRGRSTAARQALAGARLLARRRTGRACAATDVNFEPDAASR